MKKFVSVLLALTLALSLFALAGCASKTAETPAQTETPAADSTEAPAEAADAAASDKVITVGASSTPHAEILEQVKDTLAAEGWELKIVVFDDSVLPNQALESGELDANYFQHTPYLESFTMSRSASTARA